MINLSILQSNRGIIGICIHIHIGALPYKYRDIIYPGDWEPPVEMSVKSQLIPTNRIVVVKWQMKTDVRNIMLIIIDNLGGTKMDCPKRALINLGNKLGHWFIISSWISAKIMRYFMVQIWQSRQQHYMDKSHTYIYAYMYGSTAPHDLCQGSFGHWRH